MDKEIIDNIVSDKDFLEKIAMLKSVEEVKKAFKEKNLELSDKDIETMAKAIRYQIGKIEKAPEDTLEKITGGWSDPDFKKFKNISLGLSALALAISVACAANSLSANLNAHMKDVRKSWWWGLVASETPPPSLRMPTGEQ